MTSIPQSGQRRNIDVQPEQVLDAAVNAIADNDDFPLTIGGKVVRRLLPRPASTCNRIAELAGIGREVRL